MTVNKTVTIIVYVTKMVTEERTMKREKFMPETGKVYQNEGGGTYRCIEASDAQVIMQNTKSGWTLNAHGCGIYEDGTIDWDYSTGGHFAK